MLNNMKKTIQIIVCMVNTLAIIFITNSFYNMNVFAEQSSTSTKIEKTSTPSLSSDIDKTITAIKNGDTNKGKEQLSIIKDKIEENPDTFTGENHIENALQALNDGDDNKAIIHAEEAKILNAK
jgi:hypothetical protein